MPSRVELTKNPQCVTMFGGYTSVINYLGKLYNRCHIYSMPTYVRSWKFGISRKEWSKDLVNIHDHPDIFLWTFIIIHDIFLWVVLPQKLNWIQIFGSNRHLKLSLCANSSMVTVPRRVSIAFDTGTDFPYPIMCTEALGTGVTINQRIETL